MMDETTGKKLWIRPEVSLGDILMSIGFAIAGISSFFVLSERVATNYVEFKAYKASQDDRNKKTDEDTKEARQAALQFRLEIISQLRDLNQNVVLLRERAAQNEVRSQSRK